MTKAEEKAEVLNAFFASVFFTLGTQPPELEDRDRSRMKTPLSMGK